MSFMLPFPLLDMTGLLSLLFLSIRLVVGCIIMFSVSDILLLSLTYMRQDVPSFAACRVNKVLYKVITEHA